MVTPAVERGRRRDFGPLEEILEIIILVLHVNNFAAVTWTSIPERPYSKTISALWGVFFFCGQKNYVGINRVGEFVSQLLLRIQVRYERKTICSNNVCYFWSGYKGDLHSAIIILVRRTWVPPLPASRRGKMTMMSPGVCPKVVGFQLAGVWKGTKELPPGF